MSKGNVICVKWSSAQSRQEQLLSDEMAFVTKTLPPGWCKGYLSAALVGWWVRHTVWLLSTLQGLA